MVAAMPAEESMRRLRPAVLCYGILSVSTFYCARTIQRGAAAGAARSSKPATTVGTAAMGPEHASRSLMPCTSGLSTTHLVQMESDESYFPKLPDSRNPRSSHEAALYNMAFGASIAGQTNVSPIARTPAEGFMPLGGQWPGWTLLPAH